MKILDTIAVVAFLLTAAIVVVVAVSAALFFLWAPIYTTIYPKAARTTPWFNVCCILTGVPVAWLIALVLRGLYFIAQD